MAAGELTAWPAQTALSASIWGTFDEGFYRYIVDMTTGTYKSTKGRHMQGDGSTNSKEPGRHTSKVRVA